MADHIRDSFNWQRIIGTYPVLWEAQGDEWIHRVIQAISQSPAEIDSSGWSYDDTTRPFLAIKVLNKAGEVDAQLLVAPLEQHALVIVGGAGDESDNLVGALVAALQSATVQLGDEGEEHEWSAIVGFPRNRIPGSEKRLDGELRLGPMRLQPVEQVFTEAGDPHHPTLSGWSICRQVPILVEGASRGYSIEAALAQGAEKANLACALLSLIMEECVVVREGLAPLAWGRRIVPEHPPSQLLPEKDATVSVDNFAPLETPTWTQSAWTKLEADTVLADALASYHESLRAADNHPSLALVAAIASIEAIGGLVFEAERCPECRAHLHVTKRFHATLGIAVETEEASFLRGAYSPRSLTVHAGRLHGGEFTKGSLRLGMFSKNNEVTFRWNLLRRMQRAAKELLVMAFEDNLPERGPFVHS